MKNRNAQCYCNFHKLQFKQNFIQIQTEMSPPDRFEISINLRRPLTSKRLPNCSQRRPIFPVPDAKKNIQIAS